MIQATLHQMVVFEATARHGSFTRAAEELLITQPTVSGQVKQLSKVVGFPLFEQIGKSLYLTEAGKELLSTTQVIFERLENFEMKIADLKGTRRGRLRLGVITTAKYFVPRLLGSFCQQYLGIDVSLKVANHQQLQRCMLENQDDLYILSKIPKDLDLWAQPFLDNPLVVVAPKNHPLAQASNIPIKSLDDEPFVMCEQGSGTRAAVQQLFAQHQVSVRVKLELGSNEAIKQAIAGGLGISVLSRHTLEGLTEKLTILDVQHFPIKHRWYVAYFSGKRLSVIADAFLNYLLEESKQLEAASTNLLAKA